MIFFRSGRLALLSCVVGIVLAAEPVAPAGIVVRSDGGLDCDGLILDPTHCDGRWRDSQRGSQRDSGAVVRDAAGWHLTGPWRLAAGAPAEVTEDVIPEADGLRVSWHAEGAAASGQIGFACRLPGDVSRGRRFYADGLEIPLPMTSAQPDLLAGQVRTLVLPLPGGAWVELRGDLFVQVLDHREWGQDKFVVRVLTPASRAGIQIRRVAAPPLALATSDTEVVPVGEPLLLGAAAITPYRDAVAADGIGGWTDQGPNDLACLPAGPLVAGGVRFTIGDTVAMLARTRVVQRPEHVVIEAAGRHGAGLYLLHTLAWAPRQESVVGAVTVVYADGTQQHREITSGRMVADWWNPAERLSEAVLGWQGENSQARVGLYVSMLELDDRPLARIELALVADTMWAVAGLSLGPAVPLRGAPSEAIVASDRWLPTPVPLAVAAGSALDLSALTPAPVSGPGPVTVRGAQFIAADGSRLRLQGLNLCNAANFPSHAEADQLVAAVRAMGCNALRFHHHDGDLVTATGDGTTLDPDRLDRLDYLIGACHRAGLYITTDLYVSRVPPAGTFPEVTQRVRLKALIPLLPAALANWQRFATNWLTHRNPYTGTSLATDPSLVSVSLVNEDNLGLWVEQDPQVAELYAQRFAAWLAQQPGPVPTGEARNAARAAWLAQLQATAHAAMAAHLRALGVTAPLTSVNMQQTWWSMAARQSFDLVDNHSYQDHPRFPRQEWRLPIDVRQDSPVRSLLRSTTAIAVTRRLGLPFTVSELQFCAPATTRAEYAAAVPAVAGTQDWDGLWRFTLTGPVSELFADGPLGAFAIAHDPIALLSERAVALLWRRGDVAPAPVSVGLVVDPAVATANLSAGPVAQVGDLALLARIGNLTPAAAERAQADASLGLSALLQHLASGRAPAGRLPVLAADERLAATFSATGLLGSGAWDVAGRLRRSDGAVVLDALAGTLAVAGRRGCAVVLPGGQQVTVAGLTIANRDAEPATVVVAALDAADLANSRRLLVLHLTDAQNTATRFASARRNRLESWGRGPVLVRAGACRITLPGTTPGHAYALDLAGVRHDEQPLVADPAGMVLEARVARAWGPCLAWEIER